MQLIPQIGSVGRFTFKEPYDKITLPETKLSCQSIRKLTELLARNEDVFEIHYKPYGLTEADYTKDLEDDVSLVSLQAETGNWFHVPSSYLLAYPNTNGVSYTRIVLGVGLGAVSDRMDLSGLTASITAMIYDQLGITCEIKPVAVSQSTIISYEDHDKIEEIRKSKVKLFKSDSALLVEAVRDRDTAFAKIKELEDFIKRNMTRLT